MRVGSVGKFEILLAIPNNYVENANHIHIMLKSIAMVRKICLLTELNYIHQSQFSVITRLVISHRML